MLLRNGHGLTIRGNKNEDNVDHRPGVYRVGAKQWAVDLQGHTEHRLHHASMKGSVTWLSREWAGLLIVTPL